MLLNPPTVVNICFFNILERSGNAVGGGIDRATHLLAEELRKRGYRVEFYASFKPSPRYIPFVSGVLSSFFPSLFNRPAGARFREFLKEHKIDVAVWHKPGSAWTIPFSLKNLPPPPLITLYHSTPRSWGQIHADNAIKKLRSHLVQRLVQSKPCYFLLQKYHDFCHNRSLSCAIRYSDKFVLLSERFIPEFAPAKKFPEKVCAIPNIAPFGKQNVSSDEKKKELLWLGRVEFTPKRPDFMLQVWQKLQDRFPDWSLRFVGDGAYLSELKTLAKELGVKNVSFEGFQDPAPYYLSAPIFCMTSMAEGFPMVLPEAQAFGCVPVAFESFSSIRDAIDDGTNGYLVPPFDLDAYAEKLAQLMSNSELRECLARNAQKSVAKFSAGTIGDKWGNLLREVVGENL